MKRVEIPGDMDVPAWKRDTTNFQNLRWLERNLYIRNASHPKFYTIIKEVEEALGKSAANYEFNKKPNGER